MALLKAQAEKLSQDDMIRGIIEEFMITDQLFGLLDFQETKGKAYVYNREKTLATGNWLDPNEVVTESSSDFDEVMTKLRILIGDVDVDKFLSGSMNELNDQKAIQIASKAKGMSQQFRDAIVNGDNSVNAKQFDGMKALVHASQTLSAGVNGSALSMNALDELIDSVQTGADALFMTKAAYRGYKTILRAAGGTEPAQLMIKDFGMVPAHDGTPILVNDYIRSDETKGSNDDTTSVYAVNLDPAVGLHAIYGGGPAGFVMEDIGTVQNKDAERTRLKVYASMALKSTKSLSVLQGITNV
jgi:hypothetical protein